VAKDEMAKIWLSTTNHFEKSERDLYLLMDEVPVGNQKAELDVSGLPPRFFKVVIEGRYNSVNRWIVEK
jgi:hypothetical protein